MPISRSYEQNLTPDVKPFPIEVLEKVLFYLDLISLLRVRRVCKTWDSAYQNLLKLRNMCEVCCRREIPEQSLLQVIEKLYPMYPVKKIGTINWFLVYKSWFLWSKFEKLTALSEVCLEDYCDIKCMKLSGNWVIYGSIRPGRIQAYNLSTEEKIVIYNGMPVKDICLLNNPSCHSEESKIFPNDKIIFFSDTYVITINLDDIADILNGSTNLSVNYHNNNDLYLSLMIQWLFIVKNSFINKMQSLGFSVNADDDNWCSKVSIMQNVRIYSSGVVQLLSLENELYESDDYYDVRVEIRHWFQLDLNVLFGIAVRVFHVVFFIVGDKITVLKPPDELFIIRTATLHCNVLFLGNNKGTIFAYKLKSLENILTIDLSRYTWKYKLCSEEIVSIEVHYGEEHNHSLIVASQHHIYKLL